MKNKITINIEKQLEKQLSLLDKKQFHMIFYSYDLCFSNILHYPGIIATKGLNAFNKLLGRPHLHKSLEHVGYISDNDGKPHNIQTFESDFFFGNITFNLFDKLRKFKGVVSIASFDAIEMNLKEVKAALDSFMQKNQYRKYNSLAAMLSGIDIDAMDKVIKIKRGRNRFCSSLVISAFNIALNATKKTRKNLGKIDTSADLEKLFAKETHNNTSGYNELTPTDMMYLMRKKKIPVKVIFDYKTIKNSVKC